MEPASLDTTKSAPREGSLENPEVLENVPGHVIPILEREFDDFDTESTRYLKGQLEEDDFIKFRLKQGVYGQRQPDVQMIRVKLPMGGVTPDQLDAFADVIDEYVPLRKGHITTRQNIQMHHIPLPDVAKLMREIAEVGLSSREGCGNTMRNVTGDPRAGVLEGELFDITPYAGAYVRYFVRHPTTPGDAAQGQDRVHGNRRRQRDHPDPRHGLHPARPRRRPWRGGPGRGRHLDHAAAGADAVRVRGARQRRLPEGDRGMHADLRPPGLPARQPCAGPDQGADRQDRHRRVPRARRGGTTGRLGRRARLLAARDPVRLRRGGVMHRRARTRTPRRTATSGSSTGSWSRIRRLSARADSSPSRSRSRAAT